MKISKNSWHYRMNRWNDDDFVAKFKAGRYTTCSYVRVTIGTILALFVKIAALLAIASLIGFVVGSMFVVPTLVYMGIAPYELAGIMCVAGWIMTICFLVYALIDQIQMWLKHRAESAEDRPKKEPNVFVQAIIDKHNKFCTLVTAE